MTISTALVIAGESEYNELLIMQGKLGSLVLKIQKTVESAHVDIDELKQGYHTSLILE